MRAHPAAVASADPELERLLGAWDAAGNLERIDLRDPIAAFGIPAIGPLIERIADGRHPASAVVVLEAIGRTHPDAAVDALRRAADLSDDVRDLARGAIARLRPLRPAVAPSAPRGSGVLEEVVAYQRPPASQGPCQFLTKAGKPCQNPGRYWRDGRWSCSRNHAL